MDEWETVVRSYQDSIDPTNISKILKSAEIVFAEDLASFETEWILATLLREPINLFDKVAEQCLNRVWNKCYINFFKLLGNIVLKYECAYTYYEDIVTLCLLPYDAYTRQHALLCLSCVVSRSSLGARDWDQHLISLEIGTTCKVELALLIGTICSYHPEFVEKQMISVWRVLLNLLDINKSSVNLIKTALDGIAALLKFFEMDVPIMEVDMLYDKLIILLDLPKCEQQVLLLLHRHAMLFRELVSECSHVRAKVRARVRGASCVCARAALRSLFEAVEPVMTRDHIEEIINTEILPLTTSNYYYEKFTALYLLMDIYKSKGIGDLNEHIDIQALEYDIRHGNVNNETCEAISWCVQASLVHSDRLLETAIVCYDKFLEIKRKDAVIHPILSADDELRNATVMFLISETTRSASKQQKYIQLWRDLFDTNNNDDEVVMENATFVADDVLEYFLGALQGLGNEEMPARLASQLWVLVLVLRIHPRSHAQLSRALSAAARRDARAVCAAVVCAASTEVGYEKFSIEQCLEDDEKLECSLALMGARNDTLYRISEMIAALETIFTSDKMEAPTLSRALYVLENVIQRPGINESDTIEIIRHIENRLRRIDRQKRDERILYRDIITFLGKYGGRCSNTTTSDNILIGKLENKISLELPYLDTTLKINLKGVLQAALEREDVGACETLCSVICANLAKKKDDLLQSVLVRVLAVLARGRVRAAGGALRGAARAHELAACIKQEKSHRTRKILLETLEALLRSEADDLLLQNVIDSIIYYEDLKSNKQAILDIIEKILELIRDNNLLCKKYLPDILIRVLTYQDANLIKIVTDVFKDKVELFDEGVLMITMDIVFRFLNSMNDKMADGPIKMALTFVKRIFESKRDCLYIVGYYLSVDGISLTVLVAIKRIFDIDNNTAKIVIEMFKDKLFSCDGFDEQNGLFSFIANYIDALIDVDSVNTYKLVSRGIKKLTPESIVSQSTDLSRCLSLLKKTKDYDPIAMNKCLENVLKRLPLKKMTRSVERSAFEAKYEICVHALNILTDSFDWHDVPILIRYSDYMKFWLQWILRLDCSGYIERCLKPKMAYLYDVIDVSLKFYNDEEAVSILLTMAQKSHVSFVRSFLPATYNALVRRPYSLMLACTRQCCALVNDVVMYAVRRNRGDEVVDLVDVVWPIYSLLSTFGQKYSILLNLSSKLTPSSKPMQWVADTIMAGSLNEKLKLIVFLDDDNHVRSTLAAQLCPRAAGARWAGCARAALQALGAGGRRGLLDLVAALAEGTVDHSYCWWDDAMDTCMSALAPRADMYTLQYVYSRTFRGRGSGICDRLMVPLLRYVKPSLCEEFLSTILSDLLTLLMLTPRAITNHYSYEKCVMDYVRAFRIIQVAFERVPRENIESPRSMLYSKLNDTMGNIPFYLVCMVCKLSYALRTKVSCPEGASQAMEKICRSFHCASYNCMATAIVLKDPKPQVYATVFDENYWCKLIGDEEIELPIKEQWRKRVTHQAVPASLSELRTGTRSDELTRTPMFTRTLSENPLVYDLVQEPEEVAQPQELQVSDNPLNRHPCSAVLSSLLAAVGSRGVDVLGPLERALSEGPTPVAWLLAQAVVNSRAALRARAPALQRALLAVLARTAPRRVLNALHVDILDTLIFWRENASENTDLTIEYIINTAISNKHRHNVYWMLVHKLDKLLEIWKEARPNWTSFEKHFIDPNSDLLKVCLQILKRITKRGVQIPQLIPALLAAIESKRCVSEVSILFGLVMAVDDKRGDYIHWYLKILERLRKSDVAAYVRCLYYAQKGYPECCDEVNFRSITDLTPKIYGREKMKCLEILSTYVLTARRTDHVVSMFETVRLEENLNTVEGLKLVRNGLHLMDEHFMSYCVLQLADPCRRLCLKLRRFVFEILLKALELLLSPESSEPPPPKRSAPESNSLILGEKTSYAQSVLEGLARGIMDGNEGIRNSVRTGVGKLLNEDLGVRFCESISLAVMQAHTECEINPAAILDMFFQIFRDEKLKNTKLMYVPIELRETTSSNLSTNMMTSNILKGEGNTTAVKSEITVDDVLDSLLKFSQRNVNAATWLIVQLVKVELTRAPGFDLAGALGASVAPALASRAARWAAQAVRAGRLWRCDGLKEEINKLLQITKNDEDRSIYKLVSEDYKIRCLGPEQFVLKSSWHYGISSPVSRNFSMKHLVETFGQLSNWENLTIQQKSAITNRLPPIWTSSYNLRMSLEDFDETDAPIWVKCMVSSCFGDFDNHAMYLEEVDKWPRNLFDVSAVQETSIWKSIRDGIDLRDIYLSDNIRQSDCVAKWAARIMIRSMFLQTSDRVPGYIVLSRSHALRWCARASECGLHAQVVECCRNITALYEEDTLRWLRQRVLSLRALALEENNSEGLRSTLNLAVMYTPYFIPYSTFGEVIGMNEAILKIKNDLKCLHKSTVVSTLDWIRQKGIECLNANTHDRKMFELVSVFAMSFYDQHWNTDYTHQKELLLNMSHALSLIIELDLAPKNKAADVIINRLDEYAGVELDDQVAEHLLNRFFLIVRNLDPISFAQLKSQINLFNKFEGHETMKRLREDEDLMKYKRCLALIGDAEHLLMQYCCQSLNVIDDKIEWTKTFEEIKNNIFENPFAGPDYRVLDKYKAKLYGIAKFDSTDKETKQRVLSTVRSDLTTPKRSFVSLSHVCPALTARDITDDSLNKLLCLKPGVTVFKFEEKIPIFVDSLRRPAVLSARLSDGSVRRYIVKRGECVRTHCAAMRLFATVRGASWVHSGYHVTPLSEDCALIQYLEGHERFRTLIASQHPIDSVLGTARGTDSELILDPSSALRHFEAMCALVPPYVLRSAVEETSACVEDFICKKTNFLEAISDMTVFSYLCGMGDRHLQNLMYSAWGSACHVDCGAALQYGARELPPARLTRNVLALCDPRVLESRLQSRIQSLQGTELLLPSISVAFKWMGPTFMDKLRYINGLIKGTSLSYTVTKEVLSKSTQPYKDKYIQLLEEVFVEFEEQECYSVEEQVSCLLLQCTDPRILSVTRANWEPWI